MAAMKCTVGSLVWCKSRDSITKGKGEDCRGKEKVVTTLSSEIGYASQRSALLDPVIWHFSLPSILSCAGFGFKFHLAKIYFT